MYARAKRLRCALKANGFFWFPMIITAVDVFPIEAPLKVPLADSRRARCSRKKCSLARASFFLQISSAREKLNLFKQKNGNTSNSKARCGNKVDKEIETTLLSLRARHINGFFTENLDARSKILDLIPRGASVGIGDSTTVRQIGIVEEMERIGRRVADGFKKTVYANTEDWEEFHLKPVKEAAMSDVFLTGTNAVTQDGRLVNVDAAGGRVAGMFSGHPTSIIIVGKNKVVKDLDEAFYRVRKVIAPSHIRIRAVELGGKRWRTPCVATGKCNDCKAKDRLCNVFTIIEGKPLFTNINVIIINEDLGLGWDESWPPERIAKIKESYKRFVWIPDIRFT